KLKGDVAEQSAILRALKRGWGVLKPVGDRLPYDLVFDVDGSLVKIQVKSAWYDSRDNVYLTDSRRTQTNRRIMKRSRYRTSDFRLRFCSGLHRGTGPLLHLPLRRVHGFREFDLAGRVGQAAAQASICQLSRCLAVDLHLGRTEGNFRVDTCQIRGSLWQW